MPWDGHVRIAPPDVGELLAAGFEGAVQHDDCARLVELVGLDHEIVLAADTADDLAVVQPVGNDIAEKRREHRIVDETRVPALGALQLLVAAQAVGERNRRHPDIFASGVGKLAQCPIKILRAQEESRMHDWAMRPRVLRDCGTFVDAILQRRVVIYTALQDPGTVKIDEPVDEHLRCAVQPTYERRELERAFLQRLGSA